MEPPPAVQTVSLVKIYRGDGVATTALNEVDLKVARGEFVAIVGPSGSGKSTLLNLIGALDKPTSGRVLIDGTDITNLDASQLAALRNRKIGFVFQSFNLIQRLTALENVEVPLALQGVVANERRKRAYAMLQQVGLELRWNHKPSALSGGEQQRVAVARALVTDPSIILGDEPTGNLDSKNTQAITQLLRDLNERTRKTVVVITHNLEVANEADRILFVRDGRIEGEEITGLGRGLDRDRDPPPNRKNVTQNPRSGPVLGKGEQVPS